jgi:tetratricopeptide (TPR) repeat protein
LSETIRLRGGAKIANVQIFLKPKAVAGGVPPEVLYAKLAGVPKAAVELYESAQKAIFEKDDTKAISQLRAALAIHKEFSLAWNDLGVLLEKAGDVPGAVEAFRAAVKFDPEAFGNLLNLGCILVEAGQYRDAERYLASALFKNGASFRGHFYMGITQLRLGRMDIAEQAFLKAIDIGGPGSARAHYLLAGVYWGAKRYKAAADHLEKYLRLDPEAKDAEKTRQSIAELRKKQS